MKSSEVVVAAAFQSHFIKEVSRSQMDGAAKFLLSKEERKELKGAEKSKLLLPLVRALIARNIVQVADGAALDNLSRVYVKNWNFLKFQYMTYVNVYAD